ncbi:hypothetical protein B0O99DRAFT_640603 [Bisporella sp. PMI_857]|nr:hypothetical protein B0O99DRAFT_640603 [Bisporella sp. PMI_857]
MDDSSMGGGLLYERSNVLLEKLLNSRDLSKPLPIVFLAHGLGGSVVKQVRVNLKSKQFLCSPADPHLGSHFSDRGAAVSKYFVDGVEGLIHLNSAFFRRTLQSGRSISLGVPLLASPVSPQCPPKAPPETGPSRSRRTPGCQ